MTARLTIHVVYDAVMDLLCAVYPVFLLRSLQMKARTKWGLILVMGGGVFAAAATFVKVAMMTEVANVADITYAWAPIAVWYQAEIYVLVIAGSIPTLRPCYNLIRGKTIISGGSGGYSNGYSKSKGNSIRLSSSGGRSRGNSKGGLGALTMHFNNVMDEECGSIHGDPSNASSMDGILPELKNTVIQIKRTDELVVSEGVVDDSEVHSARSRRYYAGQLAWGRERSNNHD